MVKSSIISKSTKEKINEVENIIYALETAYHKALWSERQMIWIKLKFWYQRLNYLKNNRNEQ